MSCQQDFVQRQCRECFGDLADDPATLRWFRGLSDADRREIVRLSGKKLGEITTLTDVGVDANRVTQDGKIGH
jgi:hypothetical protein